MNATSSWSGLDVTGDGRGLVSLAGAGMVRLLAERTGLVEGLSGVVNPRGSMVVHARGRVVTDAAVMLLTGGEAISDIDCLHGQGQVGGAVCSTATLWRTLESMTESVIAGVDRARARVRQGVWSCIDVPASRVAGRDLGDTIVLDIDATLVTAHSPKEDAAATFKKGFGFHPLVVFCDNTRELLTVQLRPGNAGSNTAADHIAALERAIAQVPWPRRRDL